MSDERQSDPSIRRVKVSAFRKLFDGGDVSFEAQTYGPGIGQSTSAAANLSSASEGRDTSSQTEPDETPATSTDMMEAGSLEEVFGVRAESHATDSSPEEASTSITPPSDLEDDSPRTGSSTADNESTPDENCVIQDRGSAHLREAFHVGDAAPSSTSSGSPLASDDIGHRETSPEPLSSMEQPMGRTEPPHTDDNPEIPDLSTRDDEIASDETASSSLRDETPSDDSDVSAEALEDDACKLPAPDDILGPSEVSSPSSSTLSSGNGSLGGTSPLPADEDEPLDEPSSPDRPESPAQLASSATSNSRPPRSQVLKPALDEGTASRASSPSQSSDLISGTPAVPDPGQIQIESQSRGIVSSHVASGLLDVSDDSTIKERLQRLYLEWRRASEALGRTPPMDRTEFAQRVRHRLRDVRREYEVERVDMRIDVESDPPRVVVTPEG